MSTSTKKSPPRAADTESGPARPGTNVPYGAALTLVGAAWLFVGGLLHPLALIPAGWAAASFAWIGLGYARLGPGVFGKREDGTISAARVAVLLPFFVSMRALFALYRLRGERTFDRVAPDLYVAGRVRARELPADVAHVVDLTAELDEPAFLREAGRYHLLPTLDGCAPEESDRAHALVRTLAAAEGEPLLIHCAFGHGRSAAVAAAVLLLRGRADTVDEALDAMRRARPNIRLTPAQRTWAQRITKQT